MNVQSDARGWDSLPEAVASVLKDLSTAHRILEMEGHGDMTLGHMSVRDPLGRGFWCKRKAIAMGEVLAPDDFVLQNFDGEKLWGTGDLHNEWPIHSEIMLARPDVNSVCHTHPFHGCIFSATEEVLRPVALEGGYFWPGVPHDKSTAELVNTKALGGQLTQALGSSLAVFMKNHGVTFCGGSVAHCMMMGIFLERACKAQLMIAASGYRWDYPSAGEMSKRTPQTFHSGLIQRSWNFYVRKLRWHDSLSELGDEGTYRLV
jgi:L-fuculose-phosphate aldolase